MTSSTLASFKRTGWRSSSSSTKRNDFITPRPAAAAAAGGHHGSGALPRRSVAASSRPVPRGPAGTTFRRPVLSSVVSPLLATSPDSLRPRPAPRPAHRSPRRSVTTTTVTANYSTRLRQSGLGQPTDRAVATHPSCTVTTVPVRHDHGADRHRLTERENPQPTSSH